MAQAKIFGRRKSLILAILAVFFYAILTGFEPPVVRASLMVLAASLAVFLGRQSWPIWNLILAALVIIFIWPHALFEVSFQLTFAATLGIMTLGQQLLKLKPKSEIRISKSETNTNVQNSKSKTVLNLGHSNFSIVSLFRRKIRVSEHFVLVISNLLIANAAIAISAYLFTAPVILFHFGKIWPLAPLVNILVMEAVFPLTILGFLTAFASLIFMPFALIFAYLAYVPAFFFVETVEIFSKIPLEPIALGKGSLVIVIGLYGVILLLMWIWTRKRTITNFKYYQ